MEIIKVAQFLSLFVANPVIQAASIPVFQVPKFESEVKWGPATWHVPRDLSDHGPGLGAPRA
jgi:hypothetical protein